MLLWEKRFRNHSEHREELNILKSIQKKYLQNNLINYLRTNTMAHKIIGVPEVNNTNNIRRGILSQRKTFKNLKLHIK